MTTLRICFVGDSITVGSGDADFLGWPGRACIAETERGHDVTLYNNGVRGDTSDMIMPRWQSECALRLPDHVNGRLVFSFGVNDMAEEKGRGVRVPIERSVANAREILAAAVDFRPTMMLGPVSTIDDMQPYIFPNGISYYFESARCVELTARYAELCEELGIPYLDLFTARAGNTDWERHQRDCDGVHAVGAGYEIIAKLLTAWSGWRSWFDE